MGDVLGLIERAEKTIDLKQAKELNANSAKTISRWKIFDASGQIRKMVCSNR